MTTTKKIEDMKGSFEDALLLFAVIAKVRAELVGIAEEDLTVAEHYIWQLVKEYGK